MKHPASLILALYMLALDAAPAAIVNTFAGTDTKGFSGDGGPPLQATLAGPHGVSVDKDGSVFIGDSKNDRVHVLKR